jgi:glycosyltransferase involved in cell wall biosynthesis
MLLDGLRQAHDVTVVNLSIGSANNGTVSYRRVLEVGKVLLQVWRKRRGVDAIYLTISQSVAGNLKDLLIYLLCARQLSRFYIHLHGGSIKKLLFDRHRILHWWSALAVRRMAGVIVSGRSHENIFASMIHPHRIHVVPNCAPDGLFVSEDTVVRKYTGTQPLRVLYLSGMTMAKGYRDLADAYLLLSEDARHRVSVDFAGRFDSDDEKAAFLGRIAGVSGIRFHGLVDDGTKRSLFAHAHVFCLPTTMFEGQPISILEAYASGCVVVTTGQDGVRDIFADGINGFEIEKRSPASIAAVLERLGSLPLAPIAARNRKLAEERHRTAQFTESVARILSGVGT